MSSFLSFQIGFATLFSLIALADNEFQMRQQFLRLYEKKQALKRQKSMYRRATTKLEEIEEEKDILQTKLDIYENPTEAETIMIEKQFQGPVLESLEFGNMLATPDEIKFKKIIGRGAFGEVASATFRGLSVAVKRISRNKVNDEATVLDFHDEIAYMMRLRHPKIVQFVAACISSPNLCIICELMEKGDLKTVLLSRDKYPLDWQWDSHPNKWQMLADVVSGMAFLHSFDPPILHRDLKAENCLCTENLDVKLGDFGSSKQLEDWNTMTQTGTPSHMAPEIVKGQQYDESSDVYSFGILLFEVAFREAPYEGLQLNPFVLAHQVANEGLRPLAIHSRSSENFRSEMTNIPLVARELMTDCLEQSQKARPPFVKILRLLQDIKEESRGTSREASLVTLEIMEP